MLVNICNNLNKFMAKTWKDEEINLDPIKGETIAVLGYGIQGDAQANNMKDSGLNVIVGLKEGGNSWKKATSDGHTVLSVAEACKRADIIHVLIPDMLQSQVYKDEIGPNLSEGNALAFSHAAAVHWNWINPPDNVDIIMVAPKGPGSKVRETFLENFGTPAIVAVSGSRRFFLATTRPSWARRREIHRDALARPPRACHARVHILAAGPCHRDGRACIRNAGKPARCSAHRSRNSHESP